MNKDSQMWGVGPISKIGGERLKGKPKKKTSAHFQFHFKLCSLEESLAMTWVYSGIGSGCWCGHFHSFYIFHSSHGLHLERSNALGTPVWNEWWWGYALLTSHQTQQTHGVYLHFPLSQKSFAHSFLFPLVKANSLQVCLPAAVISGFTCRLQYCHISSQTGLWECTDRLDRVFR